MSPLSASVSTWTSASHSGHIPVGTSSTSRKDFDYMAWLGTLQVLSIYSAVNLTAASLILQYSFLLE
jgi:hypothetical protein